MSFNKEYRERHKIRRKKRRKSLKYVDNLEKIKERQSGKL